MAFQVEDWLFLIELHCRQDTTDKQMQCCRCCRLRKDHMAGMRDGELALEFKQQLVIHT